MAFIRRHRMVLLPLFLAVLVGGGALLLLRSGSEEPDGTYPRATVQAWQEDVAKRTQHAREYAFVHTIEYLDPETDEVRTDQYTSTVRERGTNVCYKDASGEWVPSAAEWVETATGFKMDTNSWQIEVPGALGSAYAYTVGGKALSMQPSYLLLSDGVRTVSLGSLDTSVTGQIDESDPSKLVFSDVLGVNSGVDIELIVECASLHQNVVLRGKPSLPVNFSEEHSRLYVYTELGLDALTADRNIGVEIGDTEVNTAAVDLATARNVDDPIKFTLTTTVDGQEREDVLHQFIESRVWDSTGPANETCAARQLWRNPADSRTYLVESIEYAYVDGATGPITIDYENKNGTIADDETWTAEATYYVSGDVNVGAGITLTIEPGTVVKFAEDSAINVTESSAKIIAEGEPFHYIVFTSDQDDDSGEDLTESSTSGTKGDYDEAINIGSSASTSCAVEYCKIGYATDAIVAKCDFGTIKHCIIRDCDDDGMEFDGSGAPDVFNCLIADIDDTGIRVYAGQGVSMGTSTIDNCTIDSCGSYGVSVTWYPMSGTVTVAMASTLFANNSTGVYWPSGGTSALDYNGWYSNTNDVSGSASKGPNKVDVGADPYDTTNTHLGAYFINTSSPGGGQLTDVGSGSASVYTDPADFATSAPSTVSSDVTTTTTWSPRNGDTGTVDIGYHHPRVDKVINNTAINIGSSANTVDFTISPGVVVAFSGSSAKLQFKSDATQDMTLTCKGDADDPITLGGKPLVSMDIEEGYEACTGLYLATPTGSTTVTVTYARIKGLNTGVDIFNRASSDEITDCVFERNYCGLDVFQALSNRDVSVNNLLFYRCTSTGCSMDGTGFFGTQFKISNSTFDRCATGFAATRGNSDTFTVSDCLYTSCEYGINESESGSGTWSEDYNAFWDCDTNVQGESLGANSLVLLADPYDTNWTDWSDQWHLDQDGACVDGGSDVVQDADINLDTYTTSLDAKLDVATVDIGYHYPGPDGLLNVDLEDNSDGTTDLTDVVFRETEEIELNIDVASAANWELFVNNVSKDTGSGDFSDYTLDLDSVTNGDDGTYTVKIVYDDSDVGDIIFTFVIDDTNPTVTIDHPDTDEKIKGF